MRLASKDGNMVVEFSSIKGDNDQVLKTLRFRGDTQREYPISRDHYYYQVREYVLTHKYLITDDSMKAVDLAHATLWRAV
tara:strand:- start:127 stop:366 length:240 start_codon:yes stop_codon:yes gene_type:complete